jgi:hypothetical protein
MKLENAVVHEMHESARTKPKNFRSMKFNLMGESPKECNPLLFFVPFVHFVDE